MTSITLHFTYSKTRPLFHSESLNYDTIASSVVEKLKQISGEHTIWKSIVLSEKESGIRWYSAQPLAELLSQLPQSSSRDELVILVSEPEVRTSKRQAIITTEYEVTPKERRLEAQSTQRKMDEGTEDYHSESGQVFKCPILVSLPYKPDVQFDIDAYSTACVRMGSLAAMTRVRSEIGKAAVLVFMATCLEVYCTSKIENVDIPLELLIRAVVPDAAFSDHERKTMLMVRSLIVATKEVCSPGWTFTPDSIQALHGRAMIFDTKALPGVFRLTSAGGVGNYTTPHFKRISDLVSNLSSYIQHHSHPPLVKAAVAHLQFELIHPFTDGNGRVGRILIQLLLSQFCTRCNLPVELVYYLFLSKPLLYNQTTYFKFLNSIRLDGHVESWVNWFLGEIACACVEAMNLLHSVAEAKEHLEGLQSLVYATVRGEGAISVGSLATQLNLELSVIESVAEELVKSGHLVKLSNDVLVLANGLVAMQRLLAKYTVY